MNGALFSEELSMAAAKQKGFSLVELMVALVIGLVIILGAGQLFLTGFHNFNQLRDISDKQAAVMFAADVLVREMRREDFDFDRYVLKDSENGDGCSLYDTESEEPIVDGFSSGDGSCDSIDLFEDLGGGFFRVSFGLIGEAEPIRFHVMNRSKAVNPDD